MNCSECQVVTISLCFYKVAKWNVFVDCIAHFVQFLVHCFCRECSMYCKVTWALAVFTKCELQLQACIY